MVGHGIIRLEFRNQRFGRIQKSATKMKGSGQGPAEVLQEAVRGASLFSTIHTTAVSSCRG